MKNQSLLLALVLATSALVLPACATRKKDPAPQWDVATEGEVSSALDHAMEDATKGWVKLKKDGVLMFCKRKKEIGSNLPRITCLTEAEVRIQVQNMQKYRDDMRQRSGRCTLGPGCSSGGGPTAAGN